MKSLEKFTWNFNNSVWFFLMSVWTQRYKTRKEIRSDVIKGTLSILPFSCDINNNWSICFIQCLTSLLRQPFANLLDKCSKVQTALPSVICNVHCNQTCHIFLWNVSALKSSPEYKAKDPCLLLLHVLVDLLCEVYLSQMIVKNQVQDIISLNCFTQKLFKLFHEFKIASTFDELLDPCFCYSLYSILLGS